MPGLLRRFPIPDSVEGAVEVRLELSEVIRRYTPRLFLGGVTFRYAVLMAVLAVVIQAYALGERLWDWASGEISVDASWMISAGIELSLMVLITSLAVTMLVFLSQIRAYFEALSARYGALERGATEPLPEEEPSPLEEDADRPFDGAAAILGIAREAEGEMDQVERLFKFSLTFTVMLGGFLALELSLALYDVTSLPDAWFYITATLMSAALFFAAVSSALFVEAQGFMRYLCARVAALASFEALSAPPVPDGEGALARFVEHLRLSGELFGTGAVEESPPGFDAVLEGRGGLVLVRTFEDVPQAREVGELLRDARRAAEADRRLPRRVVALVTGEVGDLDVDDDLYTMLMDDRVSMDDDVRERSVQIVAEAEGHYLVLPFTVP